ncbi:amidase [Pyrus ussuriensis x Pyrus communis]|uniref:Amidase n=1 Tax=Pyrus ussuriensis x Pyrus communis TaxID=2448454 RepID=A0A5N5HGJ7_9ROSA|nr:amidase [Pyrus ussuriensis x Pyrus communis]
MGFVQAKKNLQQMVRGLVRWWVRASSVVDQMWLVGLGKKFRQRKRSLGLDFGLQQATANNGRYGGLSFGLQQDAYRLRCDEANEQEGSIQQ